MTKLYDYEKAIGPVRMRSFDSKIEIELLPLYRAFTLPENTDPESFCKQKGLEMLEELVKDYKERI